MVCIAAFIILCLISIFVAFLSIFRRDIGKRYWKTFKKAWGCVAKKATLQKCETGFKDDIKHSILKKVIIKKPKLVKPISVAIEVAAVLIVVVSIWSLVEATKAGLALWTLGTCNVQRPAACSLSADIGCSIDGDAGPKNPVEAAQYWFKGWGEIISAIPDKFRNWDVNSFDLTGIELTTGNSSTLTAIDILDPGCIACLQSYKNQLASGFFNDNRTLIVPFPIRNSDGSYKFKNSELIARYVFATNQQASPKNPGNLTASTDLLNNKSPALLILDRIYTGKDAKKRSYQSLFNDIYTDAEARQLLDQWLSEFGYDQDERAAIASNAMSESITKILEHNNDIVINNIHAKGIPTMIYDHKKHTGKYEVSQ
ncbi:hypothetical protein IKF15_03800 [Candidatus Saccharibacteria bacterium]|nr:hypothetical protein [Candidatus Saccharibacteria bacterium]